MSEAVFYEQDVIAIGPEQLDQLKQLATRAPRKRARLCLHKDHSDKVQEMMIAVCKESYIRPHRQVNKNKSYHVIEGDLVVAFFDELGQIIRRIEMGITNSGKTFLYRFPGSQWHTVIALSNIVIYVETIAGPFEGTEFATWGPDEADSHGIRAFLARITT